MSMRDRLNRKMAGFSADVESRLSQLEPPSPAPSAPTASSGAAEVPPGTLREPRTGIGRVAGMPITCPRRINHQVKAQPLRMMP